MVYHKALRMWEKSWSCSVGSKFLDVEIVHAPFSGCGESESGLLCVSASHYTHVTYSTVDADH